MKKNKLFALSGLTIILLFACMNFALAQGTNNSYDSFNVKVEIPDTYSNIPAGENLWFVTKIVNLANQNRMDVTLKYEVLDSMNRSKVSKSETVAVETTASFVGNMKLPSDLKQGAYVLKVTLISNNKTSEAQASFNVAQEEPKSFITIKFSLFDIFVDIPDKYKIIAPGEELLTNIKLVNLGSAGRIDVFLDYWITDSKNNIILQKKETVAVETQANFVRSFDISKDIPEGKYTVHARITYADGKDASAHQSFEIKNKIQDKVFLFIGIGILVFAIVIYAVSKSKIWVEKAKLKSQIHQIVSKKIRD